MFRIAPANGQASLWLDGITSTAQPPAGVLDASSSAYWLLGMHGAFAHHGWQADGAANIGSGFDDDSARWLWGEAALTRSWSGAHTTRSLATSLYGLRYTDPFEYSAVAADLWPSITWHSSAFDVSAMPRGTAGSWWSGSEQLDIGVAGGVLKAAYTAGAFTTAIAGEAYSASNGTLDGTFRGVGLEVSAAIGSLEFGGGVKRWQNPVESEWGYSAYVSKSLLAGVQLDLQAARSVTDPVLASPGNFGASVGISWRILSRAPAFAQPVAQVGKAQPDGRRVVFTLETDSAESVSLSGSFSGWQPIPMHKIGKLFTVELSVPSGTHHYGFFINSTDWHVPLDAGGIIDDGFGRKNATIVIE
jgi:hypothetical protein